MATEIGLTDRLREAREVVNDIGLSSPQDADRLGEASGALYAAISSLERISLEALRPAVNLAKVIRVVRDGGSARLTIDGAEFPWYIAEEGVTVGRLGRGDVPRVIVPIVAERVEVVSSIAVTEDRLAGLDFDTIPPRGPRSEEGEPEEEPGIVRPGTDR